MREIKNNSKPYCTFKTRVLIYNQQIKHAKSTQINDKARKSEKEKQEDARYEICRI